LFCLGIKNHEFRSELADLTVPDGTDWEPVVDGSPENIRRHLEYDIQLLTNCSERVGVKVGEKFNNPKFRGMLNNYIDCLEKHNDSSMQTPVINNPAHSS